MMDLPCAAGTQQDRHAALRNYEAHLAQQHRLVEGKGDPLKRDGRTRRAPGAAAALAGIVNGISAVCADISNNRGSAVPDIVARLTFLAVKLICRRYDQRQNAHQPLWAFDRGRDRSGY